jgi:molybdopterin molybdotransferase
MITVQEAEHLIKIHWSTTGSEEIALESCTGKVLAESIYADRDYPPTDRVMMDGIAINKKAYDQGVRKFPIAGVAAAGRAPLNLENIETCIEVTTGCPLPNGADLVVPYEELCIQNGVAEIMIDKSRKVRDCVHPRGSDCHAGKLVLASGTKLKGIHLGILASFGYTKVLVKKSPKIKVIATGNELVPIHQKPQPYQIRQSNVYALRASLVSYGYCNVTIDYIPDVPEVIKSHYQVNAQAYDWLIYCGGISQGKYDYLPRIWQSMGVVQYIRGVQQKPGKPMCFGVDYENKTLVLGLPGNPVAALVCLHRYFLNRGRFYGRLQQSMTLPSGVTYFVPVNINTKHELMPILPQNSGDFVALANSDGFVELPHSQQVCTGEEDVLFYPWY